MTEEGREKGKKSFSFLWNMKYPNLLAARAFLYIRLGYL
jgi:hypothetical protein